jgi:hypothetical protein
MAVPFAWPLEGGTQIQLLEWVKGLSRGTSKLWSSRMLKKS